MKQFKKILIANRGEIAVRIIRTAREMGIETVAVYTHPDRFSMHVSLANVAVFLDGENLQDTYLNQQHLIRIALEHEAEAIHPGYGFLAENASFAEAVENAGLVFIGPSPEQIRLMGEKNSAFAIADSLGLPVLKSARGSKAELLASAKYIGFPLMVKASAGGGGKGMFIVSSETELSAALDKAGRQALDYFGNSDLFIEKYVPKARHIEVQLLGDQHGSIVHLYERECSIQRRFQKIVEEAPSAFADDNLRQQLCTAALKLARSMNYRGLGTVEFLVDADSNFWFLEMNTRIQVEHPVTEAITGIDLVEQQLWVAAGNPLQLKQEHIKISGHAIEARICAEDVANEFRSAAGTIGNVWFNKMADVRTDTFIQSQTEISSLYDSLLAKQIVHAETRKEAIEQLRESLSETGIAGLQTNIPFLLQLLADSQFRNNEISISFMNDFLIQETDHSASVLAAYLIFNFFRKGNIAGNIWQHLGYWRQNMQFSIWIDDQETELITIQSGDDIELFFQNKKYVFEFTECRNGKIILKSESISSVLFILKKETHTQILIQGKSHSVRSNLISKQVEINKKKPQTESLFQSEIKSGLFGKVLSVNIAPGDLLAEGACLLTIESMKTEFRILCPQVSVVKTILVEAGEMIKDGQLLVELEEVVRHFEQSQSVEVEIQGFTRSETLNKNDII